MNYQFLTSEYLTLLLCCCFQFTKSNQRCW